MVVRGTLMNSTQVQQLLREHYHNYGINTGIVLFSPGNYKELTKELSQYLTLNMATGSPVFSPP